MSARINIVVSAFETHRHVTNETKGAITDLAALNSRALQVQEGAGKDASSRDNPDGDSADEGPYSSGAKNRPSEATFKTTNSKRKKPKPVSYTTVAKDASTREGWAKVMPKRLRRSRRVLSS